jgi:hypothetical protein
MGRLAIAACAGRSAAAAAGRFLAASAAGCFLAAAAAGRFLAASAAGSILAVPAAAGTLKSFDLPGETAICGAGIADDGMVVGNSVIGKPVENFTYQDGVFATVRAGFENGMTAMGGINHAHTLVGTNTHFTRNFTVTIAGFEIRGADRHILRLAGAEIVSANGISNDGAIVGSYTTGPTSPTLGYLKSGNVVTTIDDGSGEIVPAGVDPTGTKIVGYSVREGGAITAWEYQAGKFTPVGVPGAVATFAIGINRAGTISGTYYTGSLSSPVSHGYYYDSRHITSYDVPGATGTQFSGINAHGAITGCYSDDAGTHGLIYTP